MTPLEMIAEWRKGCSCAPKEHPEECHACTVALICSIEQALLRKVKSYSFGDSMGQEVTAGDGKLTPYTCHFVVRWVRKLLPGMDR